MSIFEIIYKTFAILAGLLLPIFPGCLALGLLLPELKKQKILFLICGLLVGHALLSSLVYMLWLAGLNIRLSVFLIVFAVLFMICYFLCKYFFNKDRQCGSSCLIEEQQSSTGKLKHRYIFIFLVAVSVIYFLIVGITSFTEEVSDWPGIGIWGLKGRIIYFTGTCADLLSNKEIAYSHPEYPLGYAFMITWCCHLAGDFDNWLIKIIPLFWGIIAFVTIFQVGRSLSGRRNTALLFALFAASTTTYFNCCIKMYSEMILISMIISGFYCLIRFMQTEEVINGLDEQYPPRPEGVEMEGHARHVCSFAPAPEEDRNNLRISQKSRWLLTGLVLLIFSCWYKTEGMLYLFAAVFGLAVFAFRDIREVRRSNWKISVYVLTVAVLLALVPWSLTKFQYGLHARDFSLSKSTFFALSPFSSEWKEIILEISNRFYHEYIFNKYNIGICCSFILISLLLLIRKDFYKLSVIKQHFIQNRHIYFVMGCSVAVAFIFFLSFFASIMPLWWHLQAVKRILMLPSLLICLVLFCKLKSDSM